MFFVLTIKISQGYDLTIKGFLKLYSLFIHISPNWLARRGKRLIAAVFDGGPLIQRSINTLVEIELFADPNALPLAFSTRSRPTRQIRARTAAAAGLT